MTRLLASVTDGPEAEMAIAAGADIIDLKDPSRGALGALPLDLIQRIVQQVAGRRPVSATIGDLPSEPNLLSDAIRATAATGVDYVKAGFFTTENLADCLRAIAPLTRDQSVVAVLFADRSSPLDDLAGFAGAGFAGVMLDTADKSSGGLTTHTSLGDLRAFVDQARALGLLCGLAGALRIEDIPALLRLAPDYLGFRGALCRGAYRQERLDPDRLQAVRRAMGPLSTPVAASH
ncbi:MAG: (5-formylfuran-3-yl)methyl phosphate synthase [Chromatiaceae bacterium]